MLNPHKEMTPNEIKTNLAHIDVFLRMTGTTLTPEQLMFIGDVIKGIDINHQLSQVTRGEMLNLN